MVELFALESVEPIKIGGMQPPTHRHEQCQLEYVARVYMVVRFFIDLSGQTSRSDTLFSATSAPG